MKHIDIMQFLTFNNVSDVLLFCHKTVIRIAIILLIFVAGLLTPTLSSGSDTTVETSAPYRERRHRQSFQ